MTKQKPLSISQAVQAVVLIGMAILIVSAIQPANAFISTDPNIQGIKLFSYFATQSNLIAAAVFLLGAAAILHQKPLGAWYASLRGASVLYMAITGIVYKLLLESTAKPGFDWTNFTLHKVVPVFIVLWFILQPSKYAVSPKGALVWLVFPLVWVIGTMVRGGIDGWYPYGFLDPSQNGGAGGVAMYIVGILLAFVAVGQLVAWVGRKRVTKQPLFG